MAVRAPSPTQPQAAARTLPSALSGDARRRWWVTHGPFVTRGTLNSVLNLSLCGLLIASFITGWIASLLGLTELGVHKYTSIAVFIVAAGHLGLHWRSLVSQVRRIGHARR